MQIVSGMGLCMDKYKIIILVLRIQLFEIFKKIKVKNVFTSYCHIYAYAPLRLESDRES